MVLLPEPFGPIRPTIRLVHREVEPVDGTQRRRNGATPSELKHRASEQAVRPQVHRQHDERRREGCANRRGRQPFDEECWTKITAASVPKTLQSADDG